jgi:hypothetical protein
MPRVVSSRKDCGTRPNKAKERILYDSRFTLVSMSMLQPLCQLPTCQSRIETSTPTSNTEGSNAQQRSKTRNQNNSQERSDTEWFAAIQTLSHSAGATIATQVDSNIDWLVGWLVDWLIGWLVGCWLVAAIAVGGCNQQDTPQQQQQQQQAAQQVCDRTALKGASEIELR